MSSLAVLLPMPFLWLYQSNALTSLLLVHMAMLQIPITHLQAEDDASAVAWTDALSSVQLHPWHAYLVELAVRVRKAAW